MRRLYSTFILLHLILALCYSQSGVFIPSERFSSALINDMCQDKYGYMWIATDYGLNRYDGYHFTTYFHSSNDSATLGSNIVTKLFQDSEGNFWIGTRTGLYRYDYTTDKFTNYPFGEKNEPRITSMIERGNKELLFGTSGRGLYTITDDNKISKIEGGYSSPGGKWYYITMLEDSQGRFWKCGYGDEVTMMDSQGVHSFLVNVGIVVRIIEYGDEMLIIGMNGISSFRNGMVADSNIDMSALGSSDAVICSAMQDHIGNIYIGTRGNGLFRLPKDSRRLERIECTLLGMDLNTAKILTINEDRYGNIWLGCQSKGLVILPSQQPQFTSWSFAAQRYFISSTITSVCKGTDGLTWCTVEGSGVFAFDATGRIVKHPNSPATTEYIFCDKKGQYWLATNEALYSYEPTTGRYLHCLSLEADKINAIIDDDEGNLYISTYSRGFCVYDPHTKSLKKYNATDRETTIGHLCNNWVIAMMRDSNGHIWLATSSGVSCYDPIKDSFQSKGFDILMDGMICFSLCETQRGDILIGTDEGLYCYTPGEAKAKPFAKDNTLGDKTIAYIAESMNGDIWCATSMGIWQYDMRKKKFIGHVNGNGLSTKEYICSVGMHTTDDAICFANNDGLTVFYPSQITGSHKQLKEVNLTAFSIAGNAVSPFSDSYTVSYLDNAITLEFSLLDFNNPRNIIYEYRINKEAWQQNPEGQNTIMLSHLQPGTYNIEVRAMSSAMYSDTKTITLKVTPPWYRSTWAQILYFVGLIGLIGLIGFNYRRRAHRILAEEKMRFLINATHDIRSPLTIIMAALGKLKEIKIEEAASPEELSNLKTQISTPVETIDRNAQRLLQLVNQILDQRRLDKKQMQLHCQETNLVEFISGVCKLYQFGADQRGITFTFEHEKDHVMGWIDRINFDKVISNLLSNAFKYTFDNGEVKVILHETDKNIELKVIDDGMGFKDENPDRLFERFYQGHNSANLGIQGTGIGLNLCRAITEMHGGSIKALRRTDKQGACFVVTIPKGNKHLRPEQIITDSPVREVLSSGTKGKKTFRQFRILIVDDEPEIARYIISELGDRYKFEHAVNGKEALKMLLTDEYDLVISDMMMPEMDGLTLLKHIKDNTNISQIPVIMLTSKAEVEHKLEGLRMGADAYMAKPFDMEELHIQIDNLINNVHRLRGKFSGALKQEERVEKVEVKGNDDVLMERIMRSVNANFSDSSYTVDTMASDVGISRAQLHRKMKEITGVSTGKFLRNLRMEQAARLLREGKINVSQIADRVGYADQAHFSTAFKAHFGQSPSEYAESHRG